MADLIAQKGLDDLVLLDSIDEEHVHNTLKGRYGQQGEMYTYIGPLLVAINPYKLLQRNGKSIYDESFVDAYRGRVYYEMPPHIFAIAEDAYSNMLRFRKQQGIVISGESGAGKTEATKQALSFIARVSGAYVAAAATKHKSNKVDAATSTALRVKDRLVTSTLVLEAFGNACTLRNDNSSRFGKLMTVHFRGSGVACGGDIQVYLLEKNRVVRQGDGERNYHILHYLTSGASAEERRVLHLATPEKYAYLSHEARKIPGCNDAAMFKAVVQCFNALGVDTTMQRSVWRMLAVVLNLGNIEFTSEVEKQEGTPHREPGAIHDYCYDNEDAPHAGIAQGQLNPQAAQIVREGESSDSLKYLAELLGVTVELIEECLTKRTLIIAGSETQALQTAPQARAARDSLAKALYERLFGFVVKAVNTSISGAVQKQEAELKPSTASTAPDVPPEEAEQTSETKPPEEENNDLAIRLLDLYGFEVYQDSTNNGFSQGLINFVNEKLQELFIKATLKTEQEEYETEGIKWTPIDYFDNHIVVELFENKPGIFALLDDACTMADASAPKLLQSFNQKLSKHAHYKQSKVNDGTFTIKHYAGEVTYTTEGMILANRDTLLNDLIKLMCASTAMPILEEMFHDKRKEADKHKRPTTAGTQFRQSVEALVEVLSECQPHYVRCIKPNPQKKPMQVDDDMFLNQVRYLGLTEATRVKRAGFAFRSPYDEFLRRYRMLSSITWPPKDVDAETAVRSLLQAIHVIPKPANATMGVGMVADKSRDKARPGAAKLALPQLPITGQLMLVPVDNKKPDSKGLPGDLGGHGTYKLKEGEDYQFGATKVFIKEPKTLFALEYMRTLALGRIVSRVAALWRAYAGKRNYRRIKAAWLKQQANTRAYLQRKRFLRMKRASIHIQAIARGFVVRNSRVVTNMREALGMIMFHGKIRRRASLRWNAPTHNDWLGILTAGTDSPAMASAALVRRLAKLKPLQTAGSIVYSDHVLKIKQDYKIMRRALVVTNDYLLNINDPWQKGQVNRATPIIHIEKVSLSPFRDSYVGIHVHNQHSYVCICETKISLVSALCERYRALTNRSLPVEVVDSWQYKAFKNDPPAKIRGMQFKLVPDPAIFEARPLDAWEQKVLSLPGGIGGRTDQDANNASDNVSTVQQAYIDAEKHRPFHGMQGDMKTLLVSVPVPRKVKLSELLTAAEKEKLSHKGYRIV